MNTVMETGSPYKGLIPYSEEDFQFFFGREAEREIIAANLIASRLTLLYGPSGVGKSSVLRAGVAHHLHEHTEENLRLQGTPEFIVVVFNAWRDDPIANLMGHIHDAVTKTFKDQTFEKAGTSALLTETIQTWTQRLDCDLLIILDQFEEYFLYHPQEDASTFDTEFPRAVNLPNSRANFLISIREDGLAKLDRFKGRVPSLFHNYLRLEYLDLDAARDAIVKPVEQYNRLHTDHAPITVEPTLIDAVLAQVKRGELILGEGGRGITTESNVKTQIETTYLQLVMTRLWDEELSGKSRSLRVETLNRLGGAKSIVRTHLDSVMNNLSKDDQATAAVFFQYLVTPSGSKIAYPVSDLITISNRSEDEVGSILKTLEKERVLRYIPPSLDQTGAVLYEIYHDVLALGILDWRSRFLQAQAQARSQRITTIASIGVSIAAVLMGIFAGDSPYFDIFFILLIAGSFIYVIYVAIVAYRSRQRKQRLKQRSRSTLW